MNLKLKQRSTISAKALKDKLKDTTNYTEKLKTKLAVIFNKSVSDFDNMSTETKEPVPNYKSSLIDDTNKSLVTITYTEDLPDNNSVPTTAFSVTSAPSGVQLQANLVTNAVVTNGKIELTLTRPLDYKHNINLNSLKMQMQVKK